MKISTQTRYAVRFLLELAACEHAPPQITKMTTQEIADKQGISEKYLEAIAAKLRKGGFVHSSKGVNGGYWLAMQPQDIRLGDLMRLMESTYFEVHCIKEHHKTCPNTNNCSLAAFWVQMERSITHMVDDVTLADIRDTPPI